MITIKKNERFHLRCNGEYATYPVHENGIYIGNLECYASDVSYWLKELNAGYRGGPFFPRDTTILGKNSLSETFP